MCVIVFGMCMRASALIPMTLMGHVRHVSGHVRGACAPHVHQICPKKACALLYQRHVRALCAHLFGHVRASGIHNHMTDITGHVHQDPKGMCGYVCACAGGFLCPGGARCPTTDNEYHKTTNKRPPHMPPHMPSANVSAHASAHAPEQRVHMPFTIQHFRHYSHECSVYIYIYVY
jgi:hypothetical protein